MKYIIKLELDFSFFEEHDSYSKEDLLCVIIQYIRRTDDIWMYIKDEYIHTCPYYNDWLTNYLDLENSNIISYMDSLITDIRSILLEHNIYNENLMVENILRGNLLVLIPKNILLNKLNQELSDAHRYELRNRDR